MTKQNPILPITFYQKLVDLSSQYHEKTAIIDGFNRYTYREFLNRVDRLAAGYHHIGIQKGAHVLLQLPNSAGFLFTIFALAKIGAIPIMGLPSLREADLKHIICFTRPAAYIVADQYLGYDFKQLASQLQQDFPFIKQVIFDSTEPDQQTIEALSTTTWEDLSEAAQPSDLVFLLLSGGTTNIPKLIPRTHADYLYNATKAAARCNMDQDTVYLAALPIAHNFALGNAGVLGTLLSGGTVVLSKTSSPDEVLTLIAQERVTQTAMVPSVVSLCLDMLEWWEELDLSSWKVLQVGGSVLEPSIAQRILSCLPCKLQQTFGIGEGLTCMTSLVDDDDTIVSCQGKPISELDEIKIIDENGLSLPPLQYGELVTRGPYTIHAYYQGGQNNVDCFTKDGYYRPGDRAMLTAAGNLIVSGRISEQINRAGEKIMPIELETCLCQHPAIKEASVVGIPDDMYGHQTCAFLICEDPCLNLAAVNLFLKDLGLAEYKRIDQLFRLESYPLTTVGKVDKKCLANMARTPNDLGKR